MRRKSILTIENGKIVLFMVLAILANLCACYYFNVGVKYIMAVAVMGWTMLEFIIHPDWKKAAHFMKYYIFFVFPFFLFWVWSLVIWILELQTLDYIIRGSLNTIYMFTVVGYVVGGYYLFGARSIYLNFYAMCIANTVKMIEQMRIWGAGRLAQEFVTLIISFANKTGQAISQLELSDMVFGYGPYILFFLFYRKEGRIRLGHLLLACFFFVLALKRIAVAAVILPIPVIVIYNRLSESKKRIAAVILGYGSIIGVFIYIWSIKTGLFMELADMLGINMMSRDYFYTRYRDFYELSPTFIGRGVRFIYRYEQTVIGAVRQMHNMFLQMYIEIGFCTWIIWLWYEMRFRIYSVGKKVGFEAVSILLAGTLYMWATYATDNTLYYWPPNVSYMHLSIFWIEMVILKKGQTISPLPDNAAGTEKVHFFRKITF